MALSETHVLGAMALAAGAYFLWSRRSANAPEAGPGEPVRASIELARVPEVFRALQDTGEEGSFAVVAAPQTSTPGEDDPIHVQLAIHDGRPGLDWVLLSDRNVDDRERFIAFVTSQGFGVEECDREGIPYLRVEAGYRSPELCIDLLRALYGLAPADHVEVEAFGFRWPRSR